MDFKHMIGNVYLTPYEPAGKVRVLYVDWSGFPFSDYMAHVEYIEDHPHGYKKGQRGNYFARQLKPQNG